VTYLNPSAVCFQTNNPILTDHGIVHDTGRQIQSVAGLQVD